MKKLARFGRFLTPLVLASPVVLTLSCSSKVVSFKGSTSMWSFLNDLSKVIYKNDRYLADIESLGSSAGIDNLVNARTDFAALSKNPVGEHNSMSEENKAKWKAQKIKTVPVAQEKMAFLLQVKPADVKKHFFFDHTNWQKIINAFGGDYQLMINDLLAENEKLPEDQNYPIAVFYRAGGYNVSGKAETFVKDNPYVNEIVPSPNAQSYLRNTLGNTKVSITNLDESDAKAMPDFLNSNATSKMAFFSYGFLENNKSLWQKPNFVLVQQKQETVLVKPEEETYGWTRFFYLSFSLLNNLPKKLSLLTSFLSPTNRVKPEIMKVYANNSLSAPNANLLKTIFNLEADDEQNWSELAKAAKTLTPDYQ
ncbi:Uncharacterised protein [Mycoplasmopsis columbinasalis]|uniref:Uncharacterized protein n=2 Tax=Mycoplasmopsis columbinasalis TaxID=114880 RepID=A0A449BB93_9BACT|nr:Uncharacterised protein [Mycoplasmopsis columbinasalis]